jgi:hypothetical protein
MTIGYNPRIVTDGLAFYVDFANPKSINPTTLALTDLSPNKLPISLTNPGEASCSISNGVADFAPTTVGGIASYYTISNSYFNSIRIECSLECCLYVRQNWGSGSYVRGVSPRVTEVGSPLGFSVGTDRFYIETATTTGWKTTQQISLDAGYSKWIHVVQTTSGAGDSTITYINGKLGATLSLVGSLPSQFSGLLIGRGFYAGIRNFDGKVSFVKIYNRALTQLEITQNFNALRGRYGI